MEKMLYKKTYKDLYLPKTSPSTIIVPEIKFAMLDGTGDPNGDEFALATAALYSFSYAVKMSYKSDNVPEGFYDYAVFPLEGVWDLVDKSLSPKDKSNFSYKLMIRQPDFLNKDWFDYFMDKTKNKKPNIYLDKMRYESIEEGFCCQMLHMGSYDEEPESFNQMEEFCKRNGYERISKKHREIYLSDPRKIAADKLKTVLRFRIR